MARMVPFQRRKERDDDLILFRELQKRENERNSNLLHPFSIDDYHYDSNGKHSLYRIPSGKKESGYEFLADSHKNDYDWLKTPPATPLFPSLEMESNAPSAHQLVVQKELPITQPLSRFAGNDLEASKPKTSDGRANHMNSSKAKIPMRSITPSQTQIAGSDLEVSKPKASDGRANNMNSSESKLPKRSTIPSPTQFAGSDLEVSKPKASDGRANRMNLSKAKLPMRSITPSHNRQRPSIVKNTNEQGSGIHTTNNSSYSKQNVAATASSAKATIRKQSSDADSLALNLRKSVEANDSQRKPKSRGLSPLVRSMVVPHLAEEFPGEAPPNLRTDHRSLSATRGRINNSTSAVVAFQNPDPTPRAGRQSRSPSPSVSNSWNQLETTQKQLTYQKERSILAAGTKENRAHVMGSKMVQKVVNARKSAINQAERETKPKPLKYRE